MENCSKKCGFPLTIVFFWSFIIKVRFVDWIINRSGVLLPEQWISSGLLQTWFRTYHIIMLFILFDLSFAWQFYTSRKIYSSERRVYLLKEKICFFQKIYSEETYLLSENGSIFLNTFLHSVFYLDWKCWVNYTFQWFCSPTCDCVVGTPHCALLFFDVFA